jgi:hypothetical protein
MSLLQNLLERTRRFWIVTHTLLSTTLASQIGAYLFSDEGISGYDGWGLIIVGLTTTVALAILVLQELLHARPSAWLYALVGVFEVGTCLGGTALFVLELFYEDLVLPVAVIGLWLLMTGIRDLTMARTTTTV